MVILGQKLTVPDTEDTKNDEPAVPKSYTVQLGDTLTGVAARFKLSPQELADMNGLKANSNLIRGANLTLVASNSNKKSADKKVDAELDESKEQSAKQSSGSSKNTASTDTESYKVSRGESLNSIAAKYDVSVAELAKLNKIAVNTMVQIGQSLSVPKLTTNYTIKRGDTLIKVASKHGVSVDELAKMNNISPTTNVKLGEVLVVPNRS